MEIKVLCDKENYLIGFAEVGDLEKSICITVPNELIIKEETYSNNWNGKKFTLGKLIEVKEYLKDEFYDNYLYYKVVNGTLVYDDLRKQKYELEQTNLKKEELRKNIMDLYQQKSFYESKNWDTKTVISNIQILEKELNDL